jgi:hypothetical protein
MDEDQRSSSAGPDATMLRLLDAQPADGVRPRPVASGKQPYVRFNPSGVSTDGCRLYLTSTRDGRTGDNRRAPAAFARRASAGKLPTRGEWYYIGIFKFSYIARLVLFMS